METYQTDTLKDQQAKPRARILIAEDDLSIEPIWDYIITKADHNATYEWAITEKDAAELIETSISQGRPYDLVVSDIFLEGEHTGLDLWNRYHKALEGRIILVSSLDYNKMSRYLGHEDETPLYLKKPLVPHECIEAIYGMLHVGHLNWR